jgi:hypothetical protein
MDVKKSHINILVKKHQKNSRAFISFFTFWVFVIRWLFILTPFIIYLEYNINNKEFIDSHVVFSLFFIYSIYFIRNHFKKYKEDFELIKKIYFSNQFNKKEFINYSKYYLKFLLLNTFFYEKDKYELSQKALTQLLQTVSLEDTYNSLVIENSLDMNLDLYSYYLESKRNKFNTEELNFISDNLIDIDSTWEFCNPVYFDFIKDLKKLKNNIISNKLREFS